MGYMLYYLENLGLKNLVFNTHHLPKTVELAAKNLTHGQGYTVQFSHEPRLLGSGGGILQAKKYLFATDVATGDRPENCFVVANADEVFLFNHLHGLSPLVAFHKKNGALATLLTTEHPDAGKSLGGVWAHPTTGEITRLGGTHAEPGAKHFAGVFVFSRRVFSYMPSAGGEFHIFKDCLHQALAAKEKVLAFHDPNLTWFDMSSENSYRQSEARALKILDASANPLDAPVPAQILRAIFKRYSP